MAQDETIRRSMKRLRQSVRRAVNDARRSAGARSRTVNFAQRTNVIVAANIGEDGAVQGVSARQDAPIHQEPGGTSQ